MEYKYKFSVIIPIYNTEKYIDEAMNSLIAQENMTFEKDIQVILINDGSTDNSEEICLKYEKKYSNIKYEKKDNGGVSSARNAGIKYIQGKYVNFLDPDDEWDANAFENVYEFFEKNYDYIDLVACPLYFFGATEGWHQLQYKFKKTKIVNILKDYTYIQLSGPSTFVKAEKLKKYKFKESLKYAEDAHFVTRVILDKMKYGVIKNVKYMYRKRIGEQSALQKSEYCKEWYIDSLKQYILDIIEYTINKIGYLPKYIQFALMYDLQWKIKIKKIPEGVLSEKEFDELIKLIIECLNYFDDTIIIQQKHLELEHKIFCLNLKYKREIEFNSVKQPFNIEYFNRETFIFDLNKIGVRLEFINVIDNSIIIEGYIPIISKIDLKESDLFIKSSNGQIYNSEFVECKRKDVYSLNRCILKNQFFKIKIPIGHIKKSVTFSIFINVENTVIRPKLMFNKYIKLNSNINRTYFTQNGYCIMYENKVFHVLNDTKKVRFGREFDYLKELNKSVKLKFVFIRFISFILKEIKRKPIWIFMDRLDKADDNAEVLYKFCLKKQDNIKKYFVIDKESKDFERLYKLGNVIPYGTYKQKLLVLLSDCIISSHVDVAMRNPFEGKAKVLKSLLEFKFVFLQHGITKDDVSSWLNKYNKNIDLFITAAEQEYKSILDNDYYYSEENVKLTGFSRYDNLIDNNNRQIIIMPTWRNSLVNKMDERGHRQYSDTFKESEYFFNYNKLLNDKRIIDIAMKNNYKILFMPHPNMQCQIRDFIKNENVEFVDYSTSYNKLFCESSLLITDYSSVAFDFAYMKKPVIYYQFDHKEVLDTTTSHFYNKGYFEYKDMGFGPVHFDYEELVNEIIKNINNNCKMDNLYKERVNKFYPFNDNNNCGRIYEEILKI